jgi:hypothetical protein
MKQLAFVLIAMIVAAGVGLWLARRPETPVTASGTYELTSFWYVKDGEAPVRIDGAIRLILLYEDLSPEALAAPSDGSVSTVSDGESK